MEKIYGIKILCFSVFLLIQGCASHTVPQTIAAKESGYTYIPVDPFSVHTSPGENCIPKYQDYNDEKYAKILEKIEYSPLLESLPDNAVRMSIEQFDTSGTVTYGPAGIGAKGESYRVTVDYVNSDTTNFPVRIAKSAQNKATGQLEYVDLLAPLGEEYKADSVVFSVLGGYAPNNDDIYTEYNIPVYVGVGLRVTANVDVIATNANISGLGVIGAEAESNALKGALIVQTLGINGKSIAAALPIQSELNRTTAQNAIVSVGQIKALLYDEKTATAPRVVGIYLPFPGGKPLVNAIISELSKGEGVEWQRPCVDAKELNKSSNSDAASSAGS